jgi:23S rRNA-intervening sequence protein
MRPHERLDVWTKGIEFAVSVYRDTEVFPKDERFGLTFDYRFVSAFKAQVRKAVTSIYD